MHSSLAQLGLSQIALAQTGADAGPIATFVNTVVKGLAMGGVYAIIALGFVIIFKATQVVNFAQGALAAAGALFLSFLVFDQVSADVPRGQTPFTWWRAPFAGDGLPSVSEQWASIVLVALVTGLVVALLAGRQISAQALAVGFVAFLACRWLATRAGFGWIESPLVSLVIALAVGGVAGWLWKSWQPPSEMLIAGAAAVVVQVLIALTNSTWIEWMGNLVIAVLFGALFGMFLERIAIRPMIGQPLFSMAIITLGLEIVIRQFASDSVRILSRPIEAPWGVDLATGADGGFRLGGVFYNWSWIAILIAATLSFVAVNIFYRSKLGVAMRAVSFDQEAGMAQGINVGQVFAIAWALGAALAVLGGVFATQPPISQEGAVTVTTALVAFRALPAIILGGLDSVKGALVGGLAIGLAEIFAGEYLAPWQRTLGAGYQQIVPYIVMLAVLLIRPYGLYGTPEVRRV